MNRRRDEMRQQEGPARAAAFPVTMRTCLPAFGDKNSRPERTWMRVPGGAVFVCRGHFPSESQSGRGGPA
jgi:hypothetical protein